MTDIKSWSTTASQNIDAVPNGFPEGMAPSGVNDAAREVMAAVRRQWNDAQWFDYGDGGKAGTYAFVSANQFKVVSSPAMDVTGEYHIGRRVKVTASTPGTIYGTITASSFSSPDTTVTVAFDTGALANEALVVQLSAQRADNQGTPGTITVDDGIETAPSIRFRGDTDTGRFFPAADTIAESTGGLERERLDSTQKTFSVPVEVPDGSETEPSIHGSDVDTGWFWSLGRSSFASSGVETFSVSGAAVTTFNNRVAGERASTSFSTGQTLTLSLTLVDDASYLLTAQESIAGNSGNPGLYLIYRRGTDDNVISIVAAPGLSVVINGSDQVAIQNTSGANRTIIAALLRLT